MSDAWEDEADRLDARALCLATITNDGGSDNHSMMTDEGGRCCEMRIADPLWSCELCHVDAHES